MQKSKSKISDNKSNSILDGSSISNGKKPKRKVGKKILLITALLVIAIMAAIGSYFIYNNQKSKQAQPDISVEVSIIDQAYEMVDQGNLDGAVALLTGVAKNATDYKQVVASYNQVASIYLYAEKYPEAISSAQKANKVLNNANSWVYIGKSYEALNNYKEAVSAYTKAVELSTDKDNPRGSYSTNTQLLNEAKAKL